jgi:multisubunit Na+/H+ antiporter MnhG subunit
MGFDIRRPIGLLFSLLGVVLVVYGLVGDPAVYRRSLGYNVNLTWGACLAVFGLFCLVLAHRGRSGARPTAASPEERATEAREQSLGLEHRP